MVKVNRSQLIVASALLLCLLPILWLVINNNQDRPQSQSVYMNSISSWQTREDSHLGDVLAMAENNWQPMAQQSRFGITDQTIWIRMQLQNPDETATYLTLHTENTYLQDAVMTAVRNNKAHDGKFETLFNHDERDTYDRHGFVYGQLELAPGESVTVYLRYTAALNSHVDLKALTLDQLSARDQAFAYKNGVFNTLFFASALLSFCAFWLLKRHYYVWYSVQILGFLMLMFTRQGGWQSGAFGLDSFWNVPLSMFSGAIVIFASMQVSQGFLQVKQHYPRVEKWLRWLIYTVISLIILSAPVALDLNWLRSQLPLFIVILSFVPIFIGVASWRRGHPEALWFIAAWMLLQLLAVVFSILEQDWLVITAMHSLTLLQIVILLQMLFMAAAIGLQIWLLKEDQQAAQAELVSVFSQRIREISDIEQLQQAKAQAEQAKLDQQLEVAGVSHDLNHHLFSIKVQLEAMKIKPNAELAEGMVTGLNEVERITRSVMKAAKQSQQSQLDTAVNLGQILEKSVQFHQDDAKRNKIQIRIFASQWQVQASEIFCQRIIDNLVRNAISHSQGKDILLAIRWRKNGIRLCVFDQGTGIEAKKLESFKQAFVQSEVAAQPQNFGLGLYIVNSLCEQSGFTLGIHSKIGRGSCFYIDIPTAERLV